ncbi:hypothetical protein [Polynucleobacter sp. CS-Odin-A6]|uniref:hypothetical protein n=1 Tax=Polynucleobacter sp. CS-Odin-A6 TaxID=2689106 RepID=UPI001C0C3B9D|nr:hypothetical protein [Polynucleobacter sp. CS-Odin-A6]MBU3621110.1 hypothetical protein [Polynucleobacter sp. CS-Odin-A6]
MSRYFIHIGYHKTATTFLQDYLFSNHEDIFYLGKATNYPRPKIIELFHNLYESSDSEFDIKKNKNLLKEILQTNDKHSNLIGLSDEGLSGGFDWFGGLTLFVAKRIYDVFPVGEVKIIIGIREPVSFLNSMYAEYVKRGGVLSFHDLISSPLSPGRHLIHKVKYFNLVSEYIKYFGINNIHIYLYEEIQQNADKVKSDIEDFLKISKSNISLNSIAKNNTSPSPFGLYIMRLLNRFFYTVDNYDSFTIFLYKILARVLQAALKINFIAKIKKLKSIKRWDIYFLEIYLADKIHSAVMNFIFKIDFLLFKKLIKTNISNINNKDKNIIILSTQESNYSLYKLLKKKIIINKYMN